MSVDEQRIFVAEWMGWTEIKNVGMGEPFGLHGGSHCHKPIPPITLDWLHECEKKLWPVESRTWNRYIDRLLEKTHDSEESPVCATAEQRLAALVETIKSRMTDPELNQQERGPFRSLVLIAFAAYVWCSVKVERAWDSERFWVCVSLVFVVIGLLCLKCDVVAQEQPMPPHRSAITPPFIMGDKVVIRRHPRNTYDLYVPEGKEPEPLLAVANMTMEELLDRVRTNRSTLYLLNFVDTRPQLKPVMLTPEDELVLSNYHQPKPQHP